MNERPMSPWLLLNSYYVFRGPDRRGPPPNISLYTFHFRRAPENGTNPRKCLLISSTSYYQFDYHCMALTLGSYKITSLLSDSLTDQLLASLGFLNYLMGSPDDKLSV